MGTGTLTRLPELRSLTLSHRGLEDVEFVRGMKSLVHLNLRYSGVRDLSPLESVTTLESVVADGCPVERLPFEPMPALRRLRVMSTRLTDEDLAVFRSANPQCVVAHRWGSALHAALEGCDRLRVRTGGTCCRTFTNERTLIELSGKNEVAAIAAQIAIDESADVGRGCMCCCADLTLEFYRGTKLAVSLGVHHGRSLQWPGGWPGEAMMTPACKSELVGWLGPRLAR
jgi:hypothetical protein